MAIDEYNNVNYFNCDLWIIIIYCPLCIPVFEKKKKKNTTGNNIGYLKTIICNFYCNVAKLLKLFNKFYS